MRWILMAAALVLALPLLGASWIVIDQFGTGQADMTTDALATDSVEVFVMPLTDFLQTIPSANNTSFILGAMYLASGDTATVVIDNGPTKTGPWATVRSAIAVGGDAGVPATASMVHTTARGFAPYFQFTVTNRGAEGVLRLLYHYPRR